jgi:hypothetical protein
MICNRIGTSLVVLSLALVPHALPANAGQHPTWKRISGDDGITVYSRKMANSSVVALKAESIIQVPIGKVMTVMDQIEQQPEWVPSLTEAKEVKRISFYERVVYSSGNAPWPVKDREFLVHSKLAVDQAERKMAVTMQSIEDPEVPVHRRRVRGELHTSTIVLQSLENDTQTYFSIEIHSDPKGWVPKWIVNLVQTRWPRRYLLGLRAQVARPDIVEHPRRAEILSSAAE